MRRNVKKNDIQRWCNDMLTGTAAFETEVTARNRAESVRMPDSWQMQISGVTANASGEIP
jgi:hypothetical protein